MGLCPRPSWESSQRSPDPLTGFEGVILLREGKGMGGKGKEGGRGGRGKKGKGEGCVMAFGGWTPLSESVIMP